MSGKFFVQLAVAIFAVPVQSGSATSTEQHNAQSLDLSTSTCPYGLLPGTVQCALSQSGAVDTIDSSRLMLPTDVRKQWPALTREALETLHRKHIPRMSEATGMVEKREDDSQMAGVGNHNYAMVCFGNKAETDDCQKNFGYYCTANGKLATTKKQTEEGCDLCDCVDLYPKPRFMCVPNYSGVYCYTGFDKRRSLPDVTRNDNFEKGLASMSGETLGRSSTDDGTDSSDTNEPQIKPGGPTPVKSSGSTIFAGNWLHKVAKILKW